MTEIRDPDLSGKRVVVLGLGLFGGGEGAARFLCAQGARVRVLDLRPAEILRPALARLSALPIEYSFGEHRPDDFEGADLVIVNPAVNPTSPWMEFFARRRIPWTTETGLFLERCRAGILAVTGTNGKSTTTALAAGLLEQAGLSVFWGGNIGRSLLMELDAIHAALARGGPRRTAVVLELSSFQLKDLRRAAPTGEPACRSPEVAVVTNFSANHLDYHGSPAAYRAAKQEILLGQDVSGVAVLNEDDPDVRTWPVRARRVGFGLAPASFVRALPDRLSIAGGAGEIFLEKTLLPGVHNRLNMAAAAAAVLSFLGRDEPPPEWASFLSSYPGLEHRLEFVREARGVRFYNDSKATTPTAVSVALSSFRGGVILIAGGRNKGADLDSFAADIAGRARRLVATGECGCHIWEAALRSGMQGAVYKEEFGEAVRAAAEEARPGEAVLLSPGCASFDRFSNYEERGQRFKEIVNAL